MKEISKLLEAKKLARDHRNTYEFQAYGNRLADEMGEPSRRALYIRLAKTEQRNLLEMAREYVLKQEHATTKGKLFMWKLKQIKEEIKEKKSKAKTDSN